MPDSEYLAFNFLPLYRAGYEKIYTDPMNCAKFEQPGLQEAFVGKVARLISMAIKSKFTAKVFVHRSGATI